MTDAVLGHLCDGLKRFQNTKGACSPIISEEGIVLGCEGENETRITHCPFCGVALSTAGEK